MSGPFAYAVSELDEALQDNPVFKSEVGLSYRRTKLELATARVLRRFVDELVSQGLVSTVVGDAVLGDVPEAKLK